MSIPGVDETAVEEILRRIVTALEAADFTEAKSCLRILDELKKHGAALGDDRVRETVNALEDCQAYLGVDESGAARESAARALDEWIRRRMTERDLVESDGSVERLLNEVVDSLQAGESDAARTSMEDLANALHSGMAGSGSVANRQRYAETLENIEYCLEELGATNLKDAIACAERAAERWALRA